MAGYRATYIKKFETGLVQNRVNFILPEDAYPVLENAFVWRERIKRKQGFQILGRLRRTFDDASLGASGVSPWDFNLYSTLTPAITGEPNAQIEPGSAVITVAPAFTTGSIVAGSPDVPPRGYSNTENCRVWTTSTAGLLTGDSISISGVVVEAGSGDDTINGGPWIIEVVDGTSFNIGVDSQDWGIWESGGTWTKVSAGTIISDQGNGTMTSASPGVSGTINYQTGQIVITGAPSAQPTIIDVNYFPSLPVMGLRKRELNNINNEDTIAFDTKYAYEYITGSGWQEFIPGTVWTGDDADFFWTTNYWVNASNSKLFWATNFSGIAGDPIRYTDGTTWTDFSPQITDPTGTNEQLHQCLCILPFRSRLVVFNTLEGTSLANSVAYRQRIRWAAIGNPLLTDAWRDDIRGKGGFLDIPTSENIVSVGYVRDNLVIYCESSTWQLRYTGRSIAPFQIEKVNTELGAESTFSLVQFDTSIVGIGDKGIVECDSFKSSRIDIKITDLVFQFNNENEGPKRVHGIRDFYNRLAYWTYPLGVNGSTYPDRRLVYNYENDSWAIFTDSLTCLGEYQAQSGLTWESTDDTWEEANYPWVESPALFPDVVGGNQQGYVLILDKQTNNDESLTIQNIIGQSPQPTQIRSVNHNMQTGAVIKIIDIIPGTPFESLNDQIFGVVRVDEDTFNLFVYDETTRAFTLPRTDPIGIYVGGGQIQVRDNFIIQSKKFNYLEENQAIQFGYLDVHLNTTEQGEISLNVYSDYADSQAVNTLPQNSTADPFFNTVIPTTNRQGLSTSKAWQRVYAQARGAFITLEFTLSNLQLTTNAQSSEVELDAQILWMRPAGSQIPQGY